jgi:hypothetical protein
MTEKIDPSLVREPDHITSIKAAVTVAKKLSRMQETVLAVIRLFPNGIDDERLTAEMVARGHPNVESTYRKRRTDLVSKGYVVDSGRTTKNSRGSSTKVWVAINLREVA